MALAFVAAVLSMPTGTRPASSGCSGIDIDGRHIARQAELRGWRCGGGTWHRPCTFTPERDPGNSRPESKAAHRLWQRCTSSPPVMRGPARFSSSDRGPGKRAASEVLGFLQQRVLRPDQRCTIAVALAGDVMDLAADLLPLVASSHVVLVERTSPGCREGRGRTWPTATLPVAFPVET